MVSAGGEGGLTPPPAPAPAQHMVEHSRSHTCHGYCPASTLAGAEVPHPGLESEPAQGPWVEQSLRGLGTPPLCYSFPRPCPPPRGTSFLRAELSLRMTWREDGPAEAACCQQPALSPEARFLRLEARALPLDVLWRGKPICLL